MAAAEQVVPPGVDDVRHAAERLDGAVHRTPVFTSSTLGAMNGARVSLKAELLQRTGSFKVRGATNRVAHLSPAERARGVISISAGNHAQAVALACREASVDCTVLMWKSASPMKVEATRAYGATVDLDSATPDEAYDRLPGLIEATGRTLVHPFDDPLVIAGAGTVGLEICEQVPDVDVVLVPASGGGLVSGVAVAVKSLKPDAHVVAVQAAATATIPPALAAGEATRIVQGATIADALTAPMLSSLGFAICRDLVDDVVLLSEDELADGFRFTFARTKLAAEVAGAAGIAALLAGRIDVAGSHVVALVSGGNIAPEAAARLLSG
jgi:threonine dehydratase